MGLQLQGGEARDDERLGDGYDLLDYVEVV